MRNAHKFWQGKKCTHSDDQTGCKQAKNVDYVKHFILEVKLSEWVQPKSQ